MAVNKRKPRRKTAAEANASVPSAVLRAARLRSGAGVHTKRPNRSAEKRQAIQDAS